MYMICVARALTAGSRFVGCRFIMLWYLWFFGPWIMGSEFLGCRLCCWCGQCFGMGNVGPSHTVKHIDHGLLTIL